MKKMTAVMIVLTLAVALFSIANAGNKSGVGGGCGKCPQNSETAAVTPSDQFRKFQADTIDIRQEMMIKRFEVQRENLKATPDAAKVAVLKADINAIQAKIHDIREKSGIANDKCDGECDHAMDGCGKRGMGGCSKMGKGGCNGGPCGAQK